MIVFIPEFKADLLIQGLYLTKKLHERMFVFPTSCVLSSKLAFLHAKNMSFQF